MLQEYAVFIILFAVYMIATAAAGWMILRPERRRLLQQNMVEVCARLANMFLAYGSGVQRVSTQGQAQVRRIGGLISATLSTHKLHVYAGIFILFIPIAGAILLMPARTLYGYKDTSQSTDPVVMALLRGEQLAPPPPLPPELFITREVEAIRQNLSGASREWLALDPDFRQRLLTVFHLMAQKGYPMALIEGYRSPQRQAFLANQGAHVTNAGAFQSYHQYGRAADCAFLRNGKLVITEKDPWAKEGYRLYGELAESVGLVWGGRWKMMDFGHVELRGTKK